MKPSVGAERKRETISFGVNNASPGYYTLPLIAISPSFQVRSYVLDLPGDVHDKYAFAQCTAQFKLLRSLSSPIDNENNQSLKRL